MYHLKIIQISFPFVPVQAHGAVGVISIFQAKNVLLLDKVYSSQIYEAKAGLENVQFQMVNKLTLPLGLRMNGRQPRMRLAMACVRIGGGGV